MKILYIYYSEFLNTRNVKGCGGCKDNYVMEELKY